MLTNHNGQVERSLPKKKEKKEKKKTVKRTSMIAEVSVVWHPIGSDLEIGGENFLLRGNVAPDYYINTIGLYGCLVGRAHSIYRQAPERRGGRRPTERVDDWAILEPFENGSRCRCRCHSPSNILPILSVTALSGGSVLLLKKK